MNVQPQEPQVAAGVDYVRQLLLGESLEACQKARVRYGSAATIRREEAGVHILASGFFGQDYGTPASLPRLPLREIEGTPLLYGTPEIRREGSCLVVGADLIASTYFLATRYEELVRREVRDEHGRFPGRESLPYRAAFLHRPIVDEYAALLRRWRREVGEEVPEPGRTFSVLLTHDVDYVRRYPSRPLEPLRAAAKMVLGRQSPRQTAENLAVALRRRRDPYDTFDEIIRLDAMLREAPHIVHAQSVYFFLASGEGPEGGYALNSPAAQETLRRVRESGAMVGLHAGYQASLHPELLVQEKQRLEEATGLRIHQNRHHFLAWREVSDGWPLAAAGLDWDSTLGYPDVAGFRLGVCRPIPLFDPIRMEPMGIEEHPLIVMECTLNRPNYMGLDEEAAFRCCAALIEQVRKHRGELVMLWHNTAFVPDADNYHPRLYRRLLHQILSGGGPDEVAAFSPRFPEARR